MLLNPGSGVRQGRYGGCCDATELWRDGTQRRAGLADPGAEEGVPVLLTWLRNHISTGYGMHDVPVRHAGPVGPCHATRGAEMVLLVESGARCSSRGAVDQCHIETATVYRTMDTAPLCPTPP